MNIPLEETQATIEKTATGVTYKLRVKPITTPKKAPTEQQVRDTFQTPAYATDLLIPFIPKHIKNVWECASGQGKIAQRLYENGINVVTSDIAKDKLGRNIVSNFILDEAPYPVDMWIKSGEYFSIITNPPFSIKEMFVEKCMDYGVPFALLMNADYSQWSIDMVKMGCEKIIPTRRIAYITPNIVNRVNEGEGTEFLEIDSIPGKLLKKYSASQFHSMWLTYGFNLGRTETFVDLSLKDMENF